MPLLDSPRRLDAVVVEQTHARGVAARTGVEHFDERLDKERRLIRPLMQRRQCFSSSLRVLCCETSANGMPLPPNCTCLASLRRAGSPASHSKMQVDSFERKTDYRGWVSVVQAELKRRMKCRISSHTARSGHMQNMRATALSPVEEQSDSRHPH